MKRADTWGHSCYAKTARRLQEEKGYGIMAGALRGSGPSPAELPSPTVERSTLDGWWRDGGSGVRGGERRARLARLAPIGQSGAGGGTGVRSLAAIGQRRREGRARREGRELSLDTRQESLIIHTQREKFIKSQRSFSLQDFYKGLCVISLV